MQVGCPNILKTPLDIYEAAKTVFPEVRAEYSGWANLDTK